MGIITFVVVTIIVIAVVIAIEYWLCICDTKIIKDRSYLLSEPGQIGQDFDITRYWRMWLVALISFVTVILLVHLHFPNTLLGDQFWLAAQLGIFPGWIIGGIWHLFVTKPMPNIDLKNFLVILCLFLILIGIGIFHSMPKLQLQQKQMSLVHSISTNNISQVDITLDESDTMSITDSESIEIFKKFLADSKLYVCDSDNISNFGFLRIKTYSENNTLVYNTLVPTSNPDDIVLKFSEKGADVAICIPGLKRWFEQNVPNGK